MNQAELVSYLVQLWHLVNTVMNLRWKIFNQLSDHHLFKKNFASCS